MMDISLKGKKALVGGSSSGIGKAIALVLAACGADVTLMARNEEKLKDTLFKLDTTLGQQHQYVVTDFADPMAYKATVEDFFAHNDIDILINNTQGPKAGGVLSKGESDYQQAFDLLFQNAVWTTGLAIPYMRQQGWGRIINVSSMTVKEPSPMLILSNTMRTALLSWAKSLSTELAPDGITVNAVLTGFFDTDRLNSLMEMQAEQGGVSFDLVKAERIAKIPVKRLGDPMEYGYLVAFLASDYAAFLNGAAIPLDGGASVGLL